MKTLNKKTVRRILLMEPPATRPKDFSASRVRLSPFFPLGLAYLASVLRREGYEVGILDSLLEGYEDGERPYGDGTLRYGLMDDEIANRIQEFRPDVVGVSAIFSAKDYDAKNVCRLSKEVFPHVPTVLGGAYAGAAHCEILTAEEAVDFVIIGEGEQSFLDLLNRIRIGTGYEKVDGLGYRERGAIRTKRKSQYIHKLDNIPFPARDMVDMKKYFRIGYAHDRFRYQPFAQMITSRGCPNKCTYCALGNHWGHVQRFRSVRNVLEEIDILVSHYGVREIHFEDDNMAANKKRAIEIFEGIQERNYGIAWTAPSGMAVAQLDEQLLEKMAASGCYSVTLGIESGNQEVLKKLMRKPVKLDKVPELVKSIRAQGMLAKGFFMLGYPGETKETMQQTVEYARSLELDWTFFFVATPLPHTEMYDMAIREGYLEIGDFNPLTSLHESVIRTPEFDNAYVTGVREEAIVDLNFRNNPNLIKYNVDQAISDFEYVLGLYPHFDFAHAALGEAYLRKGLMDKACGSWRRAVEINPQNSEAAARLHEFCREAGPGADR